MHRYERIDDHRYDFFINTHVNLAKISFIYPNTIHQVIKYRRVHNGNIALTRDTFNRIKWTDKKNGQDVEFNTKVFKNKINSIIINPSLVGYRNYLSSNL